MDRSLKTLQQILEKSLEKHGNQVVTVSHLLNMIKLTERVEDIEDKEEARIESDAYNKTQYDPYGKS